MQPTCMINFYNMVFEGDFYQDYGTLLYYHLIWPTFMDILIDIIKA